MRSMLPHDRRFFACPSPSFAWLCLAALAFPLAVLAAGGEEEPDDRAEKKTEEKAEKKSETGPADGTPAAALRKGQYDEAIDGFKEGLDAGGQEGVKARRGLAETLTAQGKYEEAIEALRAAKDYGQAPVLLDAAGRIFLRTGRLKEAEEAFRAALAVDAKDLEALNRLGESLWKTGKVSEARASWEKIVELYEAMDADDAEELSAEQYVEMGLALVGLNRFKEANDVMFSSAQEQDAKNPSLLLEWGRVFLKKYDYKLAPEILREAIDQNPRYADALATHADYYLTDFQVGTERYALAEKQLKKALDVNPRHAEAHAFRGALWLSDGNIGRAAEDFRKSIEIDPSSLRARGQLAACLYLQAEEAAFKAATDEALKLNPKGAEFYHTVALAIESKFRYQDAVRFCDLALQLDSDYWPAYMTLGINCLRTGEEARGRKFIDQSWEHDKYNPWIFNTRVLLGHMDKNYEEYRTDHFVFKFPKKDFEVLKLYWVPLLEEAHGKLSAYYQVELPKPVYVETFSDHKWFSARTVGLEGFAASGACFGNLVTLTTPRALPQNWGAVAWHEFAHVATLALTHHRVPRWLTEGLSVYEEGRVRPRWARNFEREIADTFASGRLLPIAELDFGFSKPKYPMQVLISYFQGCLIANYVQEKWGFDAVLKILKGYGDNQGTAAIFREVLGLSLEDFDQGFFEYVAKWVEKNGYEPAIAKERIPHLQLEAEANPKDARKLVDLAWGYLTSGEDEIDASLTADKALEIDPESGDAHAILGLLAYGEKNYPAAKAKLEKALAKGTRFRFRSHLTLGKIAEKDGDKERAVEQLEVAKQISPRAGSTFPPGKNLYYQLRDLYQMLGKEDLAVKQMEELSAFAPEDPECRARIVSHYMKKEGEEAGRKAMLALEELLYLNPFESATHEYLARTAAKLGEHDVTIREYGFLLKDPETNPKVAYLALARAHAAKGEGPEAAKYAQKLLDLDESDAEAKEILEKFGGKKD